MQQGTGPIRVLHVEDGSDFAEVTATFLERENERIRVETARDGREGADLLSDGDFDCIVSDYDMPGQNGIEFLESVRATYPDLPFILFTGKGSEEVASDAISAGVTDYLQKEGGVEQYAILANRISNAVKQNRAERTARQAKQRLYELSERTNNVLWSFAGDWSELLFVNSAYEEYWGRDIDALEAEPLDFLEAIHPEDYRPTIEALERLSKGESIDIEYRLEQDDGDIRWVWVQGDPIVDEEGTVVRVSGFAHDITDRKRRQQQVADLSTRLKLAVEGTNTGIWEWDIETDEVIWDEQTESLFGYEPGSFPGHYDGFADRVHPDDLAIVDAALERAVSEGYYSAEYRISVDGRTKAWVHARAEVIYENEAPDRMVGVVTDITERKRRERKLQRQNDRLEEFARIVSHDLRNPLSVAMGRLAVAREECSSEQLDGIARAHERMNELIDSLLSLASRGETSSVDEEVPLADVAGQCWHNVETAAATLEIETECTIRADRSRLQQLLENLTQNAVEHGGPDVTIGIGELEDGTGFYVADDGPGIPEGKRERVFEVGYTDRPGGTGFGLSIVERVADSHGWKITLAESDRGGARFEVRDVEFVTT